MSLSGTCKKGTRTGHHDVHTQDGRYRSPKMGATGPEMCIAPTHVRCFPSFFLFSVRASSESHFSILLSFFSTCRPSAPKLRHYLSIIFRLTSDVVSCCPLSPIFFARSFVFMLGPLPLLIDDEISKSLIILRQSFRQSPSLCNCYITRIHDVSPGPAMFTVLVVRVQCLL